MNSHQTFWYRVWIIVFTVLIIAAYINGFRISRAILNPDCMLATLIALLSSMCILMGAREFSLAIFKRYDSLWYLSLGGFAFISFILFSSVYVSLLLAKTFLSKNIERTLSLEQLQFLVPAFAVLLIILLNSPYVLSDRRHKVAEDSRNYHHPPAHRTVVKPKTNIKTKIQSGGYAAKKVGRGLKNTIGLLKRK